MHRGIRPKVQDLIIFRRDRHFDPENIVDHSIPCLVPVRNCAFRELFIEKLVIYGLNSLLSSIFGVKVANKLFYKRTFPFLRIKKQTK